MRSRFLVVLDRVNQDFSRALDVPPGGHAQLLSLVDPDHLSETQSNGVAAQSRAVLAQMMMLFMPGGENSPPWRCALLRTERARFVLRL